MFKSLFLTVSIMVSAFDDTIPYKDHRVINQNQTHDFVLKRQNGYETIVVVLGDGSSDLDCIIRDYNGNLIASDFNEIDVCVMSVIQYNHLPLTISVRNSGIKSNFYQIVVL